MSVPGHGRLMDGTAMARQMREKMRLAVEKLNAAGGPPPTLATVLIGDDPSSAVYARTTHRRCQDVGIRCIDSRLPSSASTSETVERIAQFADDPAIHAILVQHPVPHGVDRRAVFESIPPHKDVDGVSSASLGRTILGLGGFAACTPSGIMRLLAGYKVELDGVEAVVVGRSPILGRPMASLLINAHATVTLCHSRTRNLADIIGRADLLIAAIGKPHYVQGDWIKRGAVVIDAGYNAGNVGDVDFEAAKERASMITPVPGGVGPMTIATLIEHTVEAAAAAKVP